MADGSLITRPGQVQYGELLLGAGTPYRWRSITGWEDLPALDSGTVPRSDAHGAFPGGLLAQSRTIGLDGLIIRAPRASVGAVVGTLNAGTVPVEDERPFVAWLDDRGPLLAYARATRRVIPATLGYRLGTIRGGALEFVATDPRRYELVERTAAATLPMSEPGLDWTAPDARQQFPAEQAAGLASSSASFWAVSGLTLGASGTALTATITAASAGLAWTIGPGSFRGWPVDAGQTATYLADAAPPGSNLVFHWLDDTGTYVGGIDGTRYQVTGTAPAGAAQVRPVMRWATVPTPATVTIGPTRLLLPGLGGESLDWPLSFGTPGSTGALTAANLGDAATHPLIEFRGPVVRPSLANIANGDVLEYDLALAAGDLLAVDTAAGTVTLNGTASRINTATSRSVPEQTFTLPPGTTNLHFRAAPGSSDPSASATVRYRSAYW
ncbi:phage distal tail protein [Streptomyces sp. NPDC002814]